MTVTFCPCFWFYLPHTGSLGHQLVLWKKPYIYCSKMYNFIFSTKYLTQPSATQWEHYFLFISPFLPPIRLPDDVLFPADSSPSPPAFCLPPSSLPLAQLDEYFTGQQRRSPLIPLSHTGLDLTTVHYPSPSETISSKQKRRKEKEKRERERERERERRSARASTQSQYKHWRYKTTFRVK